MRLAARCAFALVLLPALAAAAPSSAAAPSADPVAALLDELAPGGVPAGVPLYFVRSRGGVEPAAGLKIHGRKPGLALVSGTPEALAALRDAGAVVVPVPEGPPAAPRPAPALPALTYNPGIQAIVDAVDWDRVFGQLSLLSRFGYRICPLKMGNTFRLWLEGWGLQVNRYQIMCNSTEYAYNVEAIQPGTISPDTCVVLGAHYDAYGPGADDNASGCAALLYLAEALVDEPFRYTIRYVFFTGEETGLTGSTAYAQMAVATGMNILAYMNFDMLGWWTEGVPRDLEIESATEWLMSAVTGAADMYVGAPYHIHESDTPWGDHMPFWRAGFPAIEHEEAWDWGDPDFNPHYHSDLDLPEYIHPGFCYDNVKIATAGLCVLAGYLGGSVPVHLAHFEAQRDAGTVRLAWATSDGASDAVFQVHRQVAGETRRLLAGAPQVEGPVYRFVDRTPPAEAAEYWLAQQTAQGTLWLGPATVAAAEVAAAPRAPSLRALGPNPLNPSVRLALDVPLGGTVRLVIHDLRGRLVRVLLDGTLAAGGHEAAWDGCDRAGRTVPSGTYLARLETGRGVATCKLAVAR